MKSLVLVPCAGGRPAGGALSAITAMQPVGPVVVLVCGGGAKEAAVDLAQLAQVERVLVLDAEICTERLAPLVVAQTDALGCTHIVAAGGAWARALLPRVAALLDVMALSEVVRVIDERTFVRPVHSGSALLTLRSQDKVAVLSVRSSAFESPSASQGRTCAVEQLAHPAASPREPTLVGRHLPDSCGALDLIGARIVVSGGRGTGSAEGFQRLKPLANALGAAIGASRAAVDAGYAAADQQVGQTGKSVAPELYLALGISGAVQHWAGMKDSKVIVAVNLDPEAPIFQFADYGLVADLFAVLPELQTGISALPSRS